MPPDGWSRQSVYSVNQKLIHSVGITFPKCEPFSPDTGGNYPNISGVSSGGSPSIVALSSPRVVSAVRPEVLRAPRRRGISRSALAPVKDG